jgi:hypothetical protein
MAEDRRSAKADLGRPAEVGLQSAGYLPFSPDSRKRQLSRLTNANFRS